MGCRIVALCVVSAAGAGCTHVGEAASASRGEAAVPVRVATAVERDVPVRVKAIGWVEEFNSVTIKPQVGGQIIDILFQEGQPVHEGDPLFRIDSRMFETEMREAEATLARDQAWATDARSDAARVDDLFERNLAADRERDLAGATSDARLAQVRIDEAALDMARLRLSYCDIRSPLDGIAGDRWVDRGNIVKENETALVAIKQVKPILVRFAVAEKHLAAIHKQMGVTPPFVKNCTLRSERKGCRGGS